MQSNRTTASVVYAHPYDKSFNHAIFETAVRACEKIGAKTFSVDLYRDGFDPVLPKEEHGKSPSSDPLVARYSRELMESDILIFVHPNWWGQPPAILKGYIDRVIRPPHAYDFDENDSGGGLPIPRLAGKTGIVFNTSDTAEERENSYFHDPLEYIWKRCVFGFCGIERFHRTMFRVIADSSPEDRETWLEEVERIVSEACSNIVR